MDFVSSIIEHIKDNLQVGPGDTVRTFGGSPGSTGYPFITVDAFNWRDQVFNTKGPFFQETVTFQTTVATLDPAQADRIGRAARMTLMPSGGTLPKIEFDEGYEISRRPSDARKWNQPKVGPGGVTIYYFGFDTEMDVQDSIR